ncbi:MAG TPA: hypothetical protein VLH39_03025 [Magnetospirillaceae bacterium]|nr:hypothetical protein [Magnetospirillaceae bacterium]
MKRSLIPAAALALLALAPAFGASRSRGGSVDLTPSNWSLGIFLGEPTGLTVQLDLAAAQALELKAAWNFTSTGQDEGGSATIHANYVMWFPGILVLDGRDIPPFAGLGIESRFGGDFMLGIHFPFGVRHRFQKAPLELSLELAAGMSLIPSTAFIGSGGVAVRWMF